MRKSQTESTRQKIGRNRQGGRAGGTDERRERQAKLNAAEVKTNSATATWRHELWMVLIVADVGARQTDNG